MSVRVGTPVTAPKLNLTLTRNEAAIVDDPAGGPARAVYVRRDNVMVYAMETELPGDVDVIFRWRFDTGLTEVTMGKKGSSGGRPAGKGAGKGKKPGAKPKTKKAQAGSSEGGKKSKRT